MECLTRFCVCLFFVTVAVHGVTAALLKKCDAQTPCTGNAGAGDPNAVCETVANLGGDTDGNCICTGAFKNNANSDGCVAKGLLDVCANTSACIVVGGDPNAICSNNVSMGGDANGNCICTGAFKNNSNKNGCVAKALTGVVTKITTVSCNPAATGTAECQKIDAHSECKSDATTCTCKGGYKGTNSCTKVLGGTCTDASDCTTPVANSVCSGGKCECKANYIEESAICKGQITTVGCSPGDAGTNACKLVDPNSECPTDGDNCACKTGYAGTDSCTKDAGSSATSAWMTTNVFVISLLIYIPRLMLW